MELLKIEELKKSSYFLENIRWEITPRVFVKPMSSEGDEREKNIDIQHGYMFYVDLVNDRPAVVVMQLKYAFSKTVGYIYDVPEELLKEAMQCTDTECVVGMYPLTEKLVQWLKKEFGLP